MNIALTMCFSEQHIIRKSKELQIINKRSALQGGTNPIGIRFGIENLILYC